MIWLGERRGYLSDWATQRWVRATGKRVDIAVNSWLDGPTGNTKLIGKDFFADYARQHQLDLVETGVRGLLDDFDKVTGSSNDPRVVASAVKDFYERTSEYELDVWAEWHGLFRPFGTALALIFSRRLQQLNIPLSSLDSSRGMSNRILQMWDRASGQLSQTDWVRELHVTGNVLYAGSYSVCSIPGHPSPCVKVVFPLPNGNAIVLMKPTFCEDGSLLLTSKGQKFGDPGFYFVVHDLNGTTWAKYVKAMTEEITVYAAERNSARADHVLWFFGKEFFRLHYRMRVMANEPNQQVLTPAQPR